MKDLEAKVIASDLGSGRPSDRNAPRNEDTQDFEAYLYIITHDLKTYSRAMRVIPEWIEEDLKASGTSLPEEVRGHVDMLKTYAAGLDLMLDGLTELSRVGRLADATTAVPLTAVFGSAWARLKGHEAFRLDLTECSGSVLGPPNDLDRLAMAVLSNPVVHHHAGSGTVRITTRTEGTRIVVTISDDGPGVERAYREKVFGPLYTLAPRDASGTAGIGLAVARKVVRQQDGEIRMIDPPSGSGCTLEFDLPAA